MKIDVLDYGYVRLVSFMQPATGADDEWTGDLEIVRNARVSYNAEWRTGENEKNDAKLIGYLMKNRHTTPFEAMVFTFEVKAPIFIFRQWHRHRTFSFNEISARYTELPEEFYVPTPETVGIQSKTNKQARDLTEQNPAHGQNCADVIREACESGFMAYKLLLAAGVPRELARGVLPLNTYSRMFATVDLHNLFHFLRLRLDEHAQWEIRMYAKALLELIRPFVPVSVAAFKESL